MAKHKPFVIRITKLNFGVDPQPQQYYVTYHAKNGETLASSEMFTEKRNCIKNIKSMLNNMGGVNAQIFIGNVKLKDLIEDYSFKS